MISFKPMLSLKTMRAPEIITRRSCQKMCAALDDLSSYGVQMQSMRNVID